MPEKELRWVGSSKRDLMDMPEEVVDVFGFALGEAQFGRMHPNAKPLTKGVLKAKGIHEIVEHDGEGTYRCVYTVKLADIVYVLHCFQKKSKSGISTPRKEIELISQRYQAALRDAEAIQSGGAK